MSRLTELPPIGSLVNDVTQAKGAPYKYCVVQRVESSGDTKMIWGNWSNTIKGALDNATNEYMLWTSYTDCEIVNQPPKNWNEVLQ